MSNTFIPQAVEIVKQAIEADTAGEYEKALPLYRRSLEYFMTGLKYEQNPAGKWVDISPRHRQNISSHSTGKVCLHSAITVPVFVALSWLYAMFLWEETYTWSQACPFSLSASYNITLWDVIELILKFFMKRTKQYLVEFITQTNCNLHILLSTNKNIILDK